MLLLDIQTLSDNMKLPAANLKGFLEAYYLNFAKDLAPKTAVATEPENPAAGKAAPPTLLLTKDTVNDLCGRILNKKIEKEISSSDGNLGGDLKTRRAGKLPLIAFLGHFERYYGTVGFHLKHFIEGYEIKKERVEVSHTLISATTEAN